MSYWAIKMTLWLNLLKTKDNITQYHLSFLVSPEFVNALTKIFHLILFLNLLKSFHKSLWVKTCCWDDSLGTRDREWMEPECYNYIQLMTLNLMRFQLYDDVMYFWMLNNFPRINSFLFSGKFSKKVKRVLTAFPH